MIGNWKGLTMAVKKDIQELGLMKVVRRQVEVGYDTQGMPVLGVHLVHLPGWVPLSAK